MVEITLDNLVPSTLPTDGWKVRYRIKGSVGAYTNAGPFTAFPIVITTTDPAGTLYEGFILRDCGTLESTEFAWETPCDCTGVDYNPNAGGTGCEKNETMAPNITNSGFCLAASTNAVYSSFESRIYIPGFSNSDILLPPGSSGGNIFATMSLPGQWANPTSNPTIGPMNREGVWIDSDCDGNKDALASGAQTTIAFVYNNLGAPKTIYLGVGADNQFRVIANGVQVATTGSASSDIQFKIWHIIPVTANTGINYYNVVAIGDGSVNDAMAMVGYNNTAAQIRDATSDAQLDIIFHSATLRGTTYDVATCNAGWTLDTSGGQGNYICRRTLTKTCNSAV